MPPKKSKNKRTRSPAKPARPTIKKPRFGSPPASDPEVDCLRVASMIVPVPNNEERLNSADRIVGAEPRSGARRDDGPSRRHSRGRSSRSQTHDLIPILTRSKSGKALQPRGTAVQNHVENPSIPADESDLSPTSSVATDNDSLSSASSADPLTICATPSPVQVAARPKNTLRSKVEPTSAKTPSKKTDLHWTKKLKLDLATSQKEYDTIRKQLDSASMLIETLNGEKGELEQECAALLAKNQAFRSASSATDLFHSTADRVSEKDVKTLVENLNNSLDDFSMSIMDKAQELALQSDASFLAEAPQNSMTQTSLHPLLIETRNAKNTQEFILESMLHAELVCDLKEVFFSGAVAPFTLDCARSINAVYSRLVASQDDDRASWSVVQRWSSLTASCVLDPLAPESRQIRESRVAQQLEAIKGIFELAHGAPSNVFEPLRPKMKVGLEKIYEEAANVAISVRRDMISVRMNVVCPAIRDVSGCIPCFDPETMSTPWGLAGHIGEDLFASYHFGLTKTTQDGEMSYMIKPRVTTVGLLERNCGRMGRSPEL
ncbi:hypothetical protein C8F01DRAFT_30187 [Mycena amicta]|nr:hypothetical protein C8F01DRAFT_30187 [Mycena amicta]